MTFPSDVPDLPNLTEFELSALDSGINVADGHARQEPTASQQKIIDRLPDLFRHAARVPATLLDRQAQVAFLSALGQHTALRCANVLTCYSSSVAMEILSRAMQVGGIRRVGLIHPTFDNIPDILKGFGMTLIPITEDRLLDKPVGELSDVEVLFVTTPNNPTGRVLPCHQLTALAHWCASRQVLLALDTSFRGFDSRAQYDHYAVLAESGCRYVVIEDTGKLWPTLDLKVGFLVFGPGEPLMLRRIYTDILIGVSPLILLLVRHFAEDASQGGLVELHQFVGGNRALLRSHLANVAFVSFPDTDSRISVERIAVPTGRHATQMWSALRDSGVHLLPCPHFHWDDPAAGERFVRLALARPPQDIALAAAAIRRYVEQA